jgi:hypothetical protein
MATHANPLAITHNTYAYNDDEGPTVKPLLPYEAMLCYTLLLESEIEENMGPFFFFFWVRLKQCSVILRCCHMNRSFYSYKD